MAKSKKKLLLLLPIIISMLLFSSCLHAVQLNERALVQAMGIDLVDDEIKLTFQVFSPATGGGTNIGASAENAKIIESSGKTVSQAMQNATLTQGKQLFIGHMRIIIIGRELAADSIDRALSYFSSDSHSRQSISIALAKDKASDILKAKINQGILPAETLEKILLNTKENGLLLDVKLFEFIGTLQNMQQAAVMPIISVENEGEKGNEAQQAQAQGDEEKGKDESIEKVSSIKISGIGVFADSKLVCELNDEESRGLLWIIDEITRTSVITETEKYSLAVANIYNSSSKLTPKFEGDKITFNLSVKCEATLAESEIKKGVTISMDDIAVIEKACEEVIEKECEQAFDTAIVKNKADIFNFGNIVWHNEPDIWGSLKDNWTQTAKDTQLIVDANVTVNRVGLEIKTKR